MLRTLVCFLCVCFSIPSQAKLGEAVPQLIKRFGKSYTIESDAFGKTYRFRSEKLSVDVLVANGLSVTETYFSDHPLTASGEPPNDIVRAVLNTNAPRARWVEIDAVPFRADYALQSSDHEYIAALRYKGPQPEDSVWTMTVGRAKVVGSIATATSSPPSPVTIPLATPAPPSPVTIPLATPAPTPTVSAAPVILASPKPVPHIDPSAEQLGPVQIAFGLVWLACLILCVLKGRSGLIIAGVVSSVLIYFGPLITGNYIFNLLLPFALAPCWGALRLAHPKSYWTSWFYRNNVPKYYRTVQRFALKEKSSALIAEEVSAEVQQLRAEGKIKAAPKRESDQEPRSLKELSIFSSILKTKPR